MNITEIVSTTNVLSPPPPPASAPPPSTLMRVIRLIFLPVTFPFYFLAALSRRSTVRDVPNPMLICPHCGTKGNVRTRSVTRKKSISGGKVMGALFTGGISLLATGLSRKERETEASCGNCRSTWMQ